MTNPGQRDPRKFACAHVNDHGSSRSKPRLPVISKRQKGLAGEKNLLAEPTAVAKQTLVCSVVKKYQVS